VSHDHMFLELHTGIVACFQIPIRSKHDMNSYSSCSGTGGAVMLQPGGLIAATLHGKIVTSK
jgi:hypothetical protein